MSPETPGCKYRPAIIVPFQFVSSMERRVLIFLKIPLEGSFPDSNFSRGAARAAVPDDSTKEVFGDEVSPAARSHRD